MTLFRTLQSISFFYDSKVKLKLWKGCVCCGEEAGGGSLGPSGHETITVLVKMKGELMLLKALLNSCWAPVNVASKGSSRSASPYTLHFY